jgi:hypothetical protein
MKTIPPKDQAAAENAAIDFGDRVERWLAQTIHDRELSRNTVKVIIRLALNKEAQEGRSSWPSLQTMADDLGFTRKTIIKMIRALEARGHLRVQWVPTDGHGASNHYWLVLKDAQGAAAEITMEEARSWWGSVS